METKITVPPLPKDRGTKGWRKVIAGLDPSKKDGYAVLGQFLQQGDVVSVSTGTLIISVDKTFTGRRATRHGVSSTYSATVTVFVAAESGLTPVWTRTYKASSSAFGATTKKKLTALLTEYPPQPGTVTVVKEAQRPPRHEGECRWCHETVGSVFGHLVGHGDDVQVEHWRSCPTRSAENGEPCELCGVTVIAATAHRVLLRDGTGRWQTRHRPAENCTQRTVMSWEEHQELQQEALADQRRAAEGRRLAEQKREKARQRRLAVTRTREQEARAAHDAEQARIAGLKTVRSTEIELNNKSLGNGRRARLVQHTGTLEDDTKTMWWTVETYGGDLGWTGADYDPDPGSEDLYTWLPSAREAYRSLRYDPNPPPRDEPGGTSCENCNKGGARFRKHDSSGIEGIVCLDCYHTPREELSFA